MVDMKNILVLVVVVIGVNTVDHVSSSNLKGGYWLSWKSSQLSTNDIDTSLFTHLFYDYLTTDPTTYELVVPPSSEASLRDFAKILDRDPHVWLILCITQGDDSSTFARMVSNSSSRQSFIGSSIQIAREYEFDGFDLQWLFPMGQVEMDNLGHLFDEWHAAIQAESNATVQMPLMLSAMVQYAAEFNTSNGQYAYPTASIQKNLDWINVLSFDYHQGSDTTATAAPAALYDPKSPVSTSVGIGSWVKAGVSPLKLVMGLPLFGLTWQLKDASEHGIGAPSVGVGPGRGMLTYAQVVEFNKNMRATVVYDEATVSTYSFAGTSWIGYDDSRSVGTKIGFAKAHQLGGYFLGPISDDKDWEISRQASKVWDR